MLFCSNLANIYKDSPMIIIGINILVIIDIKYKIFGMLTITWLSMSKKKKLSNINSITNKIHTPNKIFTMSDSSYLIYTFIYKPNKESENKRIIYRSYLLLVVGS